MDPDPTILNITINPEPSHHPGRIMKSLSHSFAIKGIVSNWTLQLSARRYPPALKGGWMEPPAIEPIAASTTLLGEQAGWYLAVCWQVAGRTGYAASLEQQVSACLVAKSAAVLSQFVVVA
ncbi:hypothetical protein ABVT39_000812 [Epinephelus coioides]